MEMGRVMDFITRERNGTGAHDVQLLHNWHNRPGLPAAKRLLLEISCVI